MQPEKRIIFYCSSPIEEYDQSATDTSLSRDCQTNSHSVKTKYVEQVRCLHLLFRYRWIFMISSYNELYAWASCNKNYEMKIAITQKLSCIEQYESKE